MHAGHFILIIHLIMLMFEWF